MKTCNTAMYLGKTLVFKKKTGRLVFHGGHPNKRWLRAWLADVSCQVLLYIKYIIVVSFLFQESLKIKISYQ